MCKELEVSHSGFYEWLKRPESNRSKMQKDLLVRIYEVYEQSRRRYGRRRVYQVLIRSGIKVGQRMVENLMRKHAIRPWYSKKFRRPKEEKGKKKVSPNTLNRTFEKGVLNKVWLSDITHIQTSESSMSRRGNCWDNSPMESFFATLKRELYLNTKWNRQQVKTAVFEFIEGYYNRDRYHSTLGYLSPVEYEAQIKGGQTQI